MKRVIFGLRVAAVCAFAMASASCGDNTGNASCGNGILEPGEECDTSIPQGHNGACPDVAACNDQNPCTQDTVVGGGTCQAKCSHKTITMVIPNDGCCVSADPMLEPECMGCGDGVVDPAHGEICDVGIASGMPGHCPTAADCPSTQCKQLMGSACTAQCMDITTPSGATMDGCCPAGANNDPADTTHYDSDCNSNCGNGVLENGEQCDTGITAGQPGACPQNIADCGAAQVCVRQNIQGTNCQAHCVATTITTCSANTADNCCPSGCMRSTDIDCPANCGDGVVESNETCDPSASGSVCQTTADCAAIEAADTSGCTHSTLTGSAANCSAQCSTTHTTTTSSTSDNCCPPGGNANNDPDCSAICGNGVVESGELCDTTIPANVNGHCPTTSECTAMSQGTQNNCPSVTKVGTGCSQQCSSSFPAANATTSDSCCPPGNNHNTDVDCQAVCGNGVLETSAGEQCDTGITSGNGKCPTVAATDCNDNIDCTTDTIVGTGCNAHCVHTPITQCINGDSCCAPGCINATDNDCPAGCGDGTFTSGGSKTCDPCRIASGGTCPAACPSCVTATTGICPTASQCSAMTTDPCNPVVLNGSATQCTAECVNQLVTTATCGDGCCLRPSENISLCAADCPGAFCGDAIVTSPETCDGTFAVANAHYTKPAGGSSTGTTCAGSTANCDAIRDNAANAANFPDGLASSCYTSSFTGSAGSCSANCTYTEATPSGASSDGCCPAHNGGTGANDVDCAQCGNGTVEQGETCDGTFNAAQAHYTRPAGGDSACVGTNNCTCAGNVGDCNSIVTNAANSADFPDGASCYVATFSGSACNFNCSYIERAPSGSVSDGCCPANNASQPGDETNDIDCAPGCGNAKFANGSLAAGSGDSPCSADTDCGGGQFCINGVCHREACDTGIAGPSAGQAPAAGFCPTFMQCRSHTGDTSGQFAGSTTCTPIARTGSACITRCAAQTVLLPGANEINSIAPAGAGCPGPNCVPANCAMPPIVCLNNPAACSPNALTCGRSGNPPCCCWATAAPLPAGIPICQSGFDGCCPPSSGALPSGGVDSFLFDPFCIQPNTNVPPTNCGGTGQSRCCSPATAQAGDKDCYCGDGNPPVAGGNPAPGVHAEQCEDAVGNHNNFDGCTDSCTLTHTATNGIPGKVGMPCAGAMIGNAQCSPIPVCGRETDDPRLPGGYCSVGGLSGDCLTAGGGLDACKSGVCSVTTSMQCLSTAQCPGGETCVPFDATTTCFSRSPAGNGFACIQGCANEFSCRYNEGYHCVPLTAGAATPFCSPASGGKPNGGTVNGNPRPVCVSYSSDNTCKLPPEALACQGSSPDPNCDPTCGFDGNSCCCVCTGCATICGDGSVQSATGEQCDNGSAQNDSVNSVPDNYSTGVVVTGNAACVAPNGPTNCSFDMIDPACGTGGAHLPCCCFAPGVPSGCTAPTGPTNCAPQTVDTSCGATGHPPCCCGGCSTSCQARFGYIGDPCRTGSVATDCANLVAQNGAGRTHCLTYDPSMAPSLATNDPKFRTRYDVFTSGNGGFSNNGYCSTDCSLLAQDCPSMFVGSATFKGVCVPGEGQDPTAGRGVCVMGCISNTQCRFKEGYRCWPIMNLLNPLFGLPNTFLSEGPRACINPGTPPAFQGP